ncbi:predicted protein [Methanosarcina acetivorans C2A]|uniref:Uncharacterized protein n=1 Tax=Methanosarcina acetivorans (strain ATCC 35395 / DSM 2834 / JCM 12185 / C2A) TaxID=188937 RepID=Q8TJP1_METAC|nr:predicted protein [Methanosarcina acetivorans C2A]
MENWLEVKSPGPLGSARAEDVQIPVNKKMLIKSPVLFTDVPSRRYPPVFRSPRCTFAFSPPDILDLLETCPEAA